MNNIDIPSHRCVIIPGNTGELCRNPQCPVHIIPESGRSSYRHAALAHVQVQQFVYIRPVLQQNIFPGDADISCAAFHINRHVRGLNPEIPDAGFLIVKNQFPAVFHQCRALKTGFCEHGIYFLAQSSLGQRDIKHGSRPPLSVFPACQGIRRNRLPGPSVPFSSSACHTARRTAHCRGYR